MYKTKILVVAKYNVEISDKDKVNSNGKLAFMLPARSDDILNEIFETLDVTEGDDVSRYKILLEIRIDSNHFFGKTLLDVTDSSNNISIDITDCISIYNNTKLSNLNIDNNKNLNSFSLLPKLISQKPTPSIDVIDKDLFINNVEKINSSLLNSSEAISLLNELGNNQSFGSSPLYDLINEMSKDLSKTSNDSIDKKIYIFTDHEENFSFTTKDQAINSINAIELTEEVPSIITSININDNDSVSYFADDSELLGLNEIAYKTSGHSLVINDY